MIIWEAMVFGIIAGTVMVIFDGIFKMFHSEKNNIPSYSELKTIDAYWTKARIGKYEIVIRANLSSGTSFSAYITPAEATALKNQLDCAISLIEK